MATSEPDVDKLCGDFATKNAITPVLEKKVEAKTDVNIITPVKVEITSSNSDLEKLCDDFTTKNAITPDSAPTIEAETDVKTKAAVKVETKMSEVNLKTQHKTKNLGFNTAKTQDESYGEIEKKCATAKCSDSNHEGERTIPVRKANFTAESL